MATPPTTSSPGSAPSSGRDDAVGIALIVGAVLIGLLLLVKGYDAEGGVVATDDTPSAEVTTTTVPAEATTTTTLATKPPAEVSVRVANASGTSGVASKTRTTLSGKGYTQVAIGDAPSVVTSTQVLYAEGAQGDAAAVAAALGLPATAVQPMPSPPPVALQGATVLVLAGPDLA
jgi:hypothetical protein